LYGLQIEDEDFIFKVPEFMEYQNFCFPILKIEMLYDGERHQFKFKEDQGMIDFEFRKHIHQMVQSFDKFKAPEYQAVKFKTLNTEQRMIELRKQRKVFEDNDNFLTTNMTTFTAKCLARSFSRKANQLKNPILSV